jgi:DNA topoisomerase-1
MFPGKLHSIDDKRVAGGSDFGADGRLKSKKGDRVHLDRTAAEGLVRALSDTAFEVRSVESKPYRRQPYAPFRTTTLQQEASRKLGMSASVTMSVAQRLYENGFITYMRTDSTTLSSAAVNAARTQVRELYGDEYLPDAPRVYASKVKNAQEAHEAIRPAGESFRTPAQTGLTGEQFRLYELIWMRTDRLADEGRRRAVGVGPPRRRRVRRPRRGLLASGRVITFHGFLKAYVEGTEGGKRSDDDQVPLPDLHEGDPVSAAALNALGPRDQASRPLHRGHADQGARGPRDRPPSTYASIIGTILNRGYVYKKGTALVPAWLAFSVIRLLEEHFPRQISYAFTAGMEDVLDEIAAGHKDRVSELQEFYFGSDRVQGLHALVTDLGEIDARELATFPIGGPDSGINLRVGPLRPLPRGPGRRRHARRASARTSPTTCHPTSSPSRRQGAVRQPGRRGDPARRPPRHRPGGRGEERPLRPLRHRGAARRRAQERQAAHLVAVRLDVARHDHARDAVRLLSLPRVVGEDPESGEEITAQNGRYGPYLKKGSDSRSLTSEEQLLTITLDEALRIYAQPKQRGRAAAAPPLKELGNDPVSGSPVVVKSGRFGEYVTDGEYNATLRKDDSVEAITLERAAELLAERRERGPAKKASKKSGTAKTAKKTATKATKKSAAKKTTKKAAKKS